MGFSNRISETLPQMRFSNRISGASPTIASCKASAAKIYNATSSLAHFDNTSNFLSFEKNAVAYYSAGVVVVNSEGVVLSPGQGCQIFLYKIPKRGKIYQITRNYSKCT
jgi:hypothetical protein